MNFGLIDRIVEIERGERIRAVKAVSLAEEYLADHFPTFPVLPGVFMLEAMVEAAGWLVRESRDFDCSLILLRTAKNVTYKSFVKPGNVLELDVRCRSMSPDASDFSGTGHCNGEEMVKARFSLGHYAIEANGGRVPATGSGDDRMSPVNGSLIENARARYALLRS
ncbi:MAG: 3-hydroxyacyl-ACP dehydratase FabZ family protein [Planctomycetota bacterium]|jgi:3-hydroxyacyl-[acyl-carrier-protein] dehydratase